jgi:hypothetical protein
MKSLILATLIAVASSRHCSIDINKEFEYSFCEGADEPFTIDEFVFEPYPIKLHSDAIISLALGITLHEPIPVGATISFKVIKDLLIDIPFPCFDFEGFYFGSW